jgi:hypothetical protein
MLSKAVSVWVTCGVGRRGLERSAVDLEVVRSSMVFWNVGTKFGAVWNFLPPVMDSSLLVLDWATLSGLFPNPHVIQYGEQGFP